MTERVVQSHILIPATPNQEAISRGDVRNRDAGSKVAQANGRHTTLL